LRALDPDLPGEVVFVLLPAGERRRLGHFAASSWTYHADRNAHEIGISPSLFHDPQAVLTVLLHEATHALLVQQQGGCSNRYYHLTLFRDRAQQLGLACAFRDTRHGWNITCFPEGRSPARYRSVEQFLAASLPPGTTFPQKLTRGGRPLPEKGQVRLICRCTASLQRSILVSRRVLSQGGFVCRLCGAEFTPTTAAKRDCPGEAGLETPPT